MREGKGGGNVIFHCLVGVKRGRKEMGWMEGFHPGPPFFFTSKLGIKEERIGIEKKSTKLYSLFFRPSTFIN